MDEYEITFLIIGLILGMLLMSVIVTAFRPPQSHYAEGNAEWFCEHIDSTADYKLDSFEHELGILTELHCSPVESSALSIGGS